jgi:hypothetical protein
VALYSLCLAGSIWHHYAYFPTIICKWYALNRNGDGGMSLPPNSGFWKLKALWLSGCCICGRIFFKSELGNFQTVFH